jgi:hypothetical protein
MGRISARPVVKVQLERPYLIPRVGEAMLDRYGVGAVWELHLSAARLATAGDLKAGEVLLAVADLIEEVWNSPYGGHAEDGGPTL